MAKYSKSVSFKNFTFRVTEDGNGRKRIMIVEQTKDDEIYTDFDDVLMKFGGEEGLSMTLKVENSFDEE